MEKEFVTYELSLKLKELGFDEPCFSFYMGGFKELGKIKYVNPINVAETNVLAPTFSQAFRWVMQFPQIKKYRYNVALYSDGTYSLKEGKDAIYEYLSAESCLKKLIEIVEQ